MKSLYVLLGDVMSSAEALDRAKLQRRLAAACRAANRAAGTDLFAPLKPLKGVRDDGCVPGDSLIREFIGGSVYRY